MQRLICVLCKSVKRNTSKLRMQLEIKCKDLSVHSLNQWKATHPPWGCNLRSNAETYLYALPIRKKQHINPEDATQDQMQRLICMLCQSVKNNISTLRMLLEICTLHNRWKATHPSWGSNLRKNAELICTLCQSAKRNTSTLRMELEIKCSDLSVHSANQWKATNPPWGRKLRSVRSANHWKATHPPSGCNLRLYTLPISEKQHIHPEDETRDLFAVPISEKQHIHPEDATWGVSQLFSMVNFKHNAIFSA